MDTYKWIKNLTCHLLSTTYSNQMINKEHFLPIKVFLLINEKEYLKYHCFRNISKTKGLGKRPSMAANFTKGERQEVPQGGVHSPTSEVFFPKRKSQQNQNYHFIGNAEVRDSNSTNVIRKTESLRKELCDTLPNSLTKKIPLDCTKVATCHT